MKEAWTTTAQMWYNEEENLLRIEFSPKAKLGIEDMKNHYIVSKRLTGERKPLVLVDIGDYFSTTSEARRYGRQQSGSRLATAVVTQNIFSRILGNFFVIFNTSVSPIKLFSSEAKAIAWLKKI